MRFASAAEFARRARRQGLTAVLAALVIVMQYPLWFGEGGWLAVRIGANKLKTQTALNQRLRERNEMLLAEVSDLKQGHDAIEERARSELGMIAPDEIFIRVLPAPVGATPGASSSIAARTQAAATANQNSIDPLAGKSHE